MAKILLSVPHQRQQQRSDCLVACASMALAHAGVGISYERLLKLLRVRPFGASGRNLSHLTSLGVQVIYRGGAMEDLRSNLTAGHPCIVLLNTGDLSYWPYATDHAVLVVGIDEQAVYLNDPAFDEAPIRVSLIEFELAWMEMDFRYSVITR